MKDQNEQSQDPPMTILDGRLRRIEQTIIYVEKLLLMPVEIITNFDIHQSYEDNIRRLAYEYVKINWRLSNGMTNDYVDTILICKRKEVELRAKELGLDNERILGVLYSAPDKSGVILKTKTFMETFKGLAGENNEVEFKTLISELVKTGKFNDEEAQKYTQKFNREGQIFERRPGYWAKA